MSNKVAVIIGVGAVQGMGAKLAIKFARQGLHVFIAGRTHSKLQAVVDSAKGEQVQITPVVTDATNPPAISDLFEQAQQAGNIDLAIYNAGNNMPGEYLTMEASYFEACWRIGCYGGFLFSQQALRAMEPQGRGTLLFTGASASMRGKPFFAAFTTAKAGLRALAQSLAREFGPKGIHVGHVVIDGAIDGDRINLGRPDIAEALGEDKLVDLDGIVDIYAMLYQQPPRAWSHEIDVRTSMENF